MPYVIQTPEGDQMLVMGLEGHEDCTIIAQSDDDPPAFWKVENGAIVADLDAFKAAKREAINAIIDAKSAEGATCSTTAGVVQCDEKSKTNIDGLALMAFMAKVGGIAFSVDFTLYDNSNVTLDADGMIGLGKEVGSYFVATHYFGKALKASADAATSLEELDAIDIEAGWPS